MKRISAARRQLIVLIMFLCLLLCFKYANYYFNEPFSYVLDPLRALFVLAFLVQWSFSIHMRVIQTYPRRLLLFISFLLIFWYATRSIKYYALADLDLLRWAWFAFYIPMLLIPPSCVALACTIGKRESYQIPPAVFFVYGISVFLIIAVLSNDFHQKVFQFTEYPMTDTNISSVSILYYFIMFWEISLSFIALGMMFAKCRTKKLSSRIYAPFIPLIIISVYGFAYSQKWTDVYLLRDMTSINVILILTTLELAIQVGLIKVNSYYTEFFAHAKIPTAIFDGAFDICAQSHTFSNDEPLAKSNFGTVGFFDKDGVRTMCRAIDDGYVVWREDISEIMSYIDEIRDINRELEEENNVLQEMIKLEHRYQIVAQKNLLLNMVQEATGSQISLMSRYIRMYNQTQDPEEKRSILEKLVVIGSYCKRRSNLVFLGCQFDKTPAQELGLCFYESISALRLAGVQADYCCHIEQDIPIQKCFILYDAFEDIVEASITKTQVYLINIYEEPDCYLMIVNLDDGGPFESVKEKYGEHVDVFEDEDGEWRVSVTVTKGDEDDVC